jgi:hypothetical protein
LENNFSGNQRQANDPAEGESAAEAMCVSSDVIPD